MESLLDLGRTHDCGSLRASDAGSEVVLFGWIHRHRELGGRIFISLRDRAGITQLSFGPDIDAAAFAGASALALESCVGVAGRVVHRGDNANRAPARSRSRRTRLEVFSRRSRCPSTSPTTSELDAHENNRLKYRYLDLRRPSLQRNFVLRSRLATLTRHHPRRRAGFLELETPYMVKYTPGGARNFLVPSRLNPGRSTRSPSRRRSSSSCSWSPASTSTSRSPAASATRTCATIVSPSSPRSTSRCYATPEHV
jgi:aspartyl-tRNA synthetase